jgi:hypothetical protein
MRKKSRGDAIIVFFLLIFSGRGVAGRGAVNKGTWTPEEVIFDFIYFFFFF